jgi:hypothetical protein
MALESIRMKVRPWMIEWMQQKPVTGVHLLAFSHRLKMVNFTSKSLSETILIGRFSR